jgi:adenylate cyclase
MPYIHKKNGDDKTSNYPIVNKSTTIGRSDENDIVLRNVGISRKHVKIYKKAKNYFLADLGSSNGTKVNGKFIQKIKLSHNDVISIGTCDLIFFTDELSAPPQTNSLFLMEDSDQNNFYHHTLNISPQESCIMSSSELLASIESKKIIDKHGQAPSQNDISSLERSNKALFVLYEISRQLSSTSDFKELLNKIMDLIFMVIDADSGFLVLTGDKEKDELIPIVVKSKDKQKENTGKMKPSKTMLNKVIQDKVALLTTNAMDDSRFRAAESVVIKKIRSAICVPLWGKNKIIGAIQLDSTRPDNMFTKDSLELLKTIGCQMAMVIEQARLNSQIQEEEKLRNRLERFHSPQIIEMILKKSQDSSENIMEPKDLTSTILFTDIVGFTGISEKMSPREINIILNKHFSQLTDIIFKYGGTLDKFLGDGLMAIFGTPIEKKEDAENAVRAALEIRQKFAEVIKKTSPEIKFDIRVGINTGRVVAGNIGSPKRMDYTVIGDAVNIAKRIESSAKPDQILIGPETYKCVKNKFNLKKVGPKKLKGRKAETMIYEVLD